MENTGDDDTETKEIRTRLTKRRADRIASLEKYKWVEQLEFYWDKETDGPMFVSANTEKEREEIPAAVDHRPSEPFGGPNDHFGGHTLQELQAGGLKIPDPEPYHPLPLDNDAFKKAIRQHMRDVREAFETHHNPMSEEDVNNMRAVAEQNKQ